MGADKCYKRAAHYRNIFKPLLATIIKDVLGKGSKSDDVLDDLLLRSDILREFFAMRISMKDNNKAAETAAHDKLLSYLINAAWDS